MEHEPTPQDRPRRIVVGITGASGAAYAQRLIQLLLAAGVETHLVVSPMGRRLLHDELGRQSADFAASVREGDAVREGDRRAAPAARRLDRGAEAGGGARGTTAAARPDEASSRGELIQHSFRDVGAPIASGSFRCEGMIVVPCSSNTLASVASGSSDNVLARAAQVMLKERRPLVLVHREMPLSLIDIQNMHRATQAGAIVAPASPGFYLLPRTVDDLVDFVAGRCLDLLGVAHALNIRWREAGGEGRDKPREGRS